MTPDQAIEIKLERSSNTPLELGNVLVEVHFFTDGRYRYGFKAGRTNNDGNLKLSYFDFEKLRQLNAQQFLMDYNTHLEECDLRVEILVPSEQSLLESIEIVKKGYGKSPLWAANWPSNNRISAQPRIVDLSGRVTKVSIPCHIIGEEGRG